MKEDPGAGPVCPRCGSFDVEILGEATSRYQAGFHCEDCGYRWSE